MQRPHPGRHDTVGILRLSHGGEVSGLHPDETGPAVDALALWTSPESSPALLKDGM
ncbi:hypothetical protein Ate01nite_61550 [Actinoplanes teichomyceticus]|nr:hypothetical protein Ate01nite_61550 [Actinoplanes teichomyceticus]